MIEVRWHGRGGQGAFTAARLLGQAVAIHEHKYVQAFPSFGPERRGLPYWPLPVLTTRKLRTAVKWKRVITSSSSMIPCMATT